MIGTIPECEDVIRHAATLSIESARAQLKAAHAFIMSLSREEQGPLLENLKRATDDFSRRTREKQSYI